VLRAIQDAQLQETTLRLFDTVEHALAAGPIHWGMTRPHGKTTPSSCTENGVSSGDDHASPPALESRRGPRRSEPAGGRTQFPAPRPDMNADG
jgi:hypothetical protein